MFLLYFCFARYYALSDFSLTVTSLCRLCAGLPPYQAYQLLRGQQFINEFLKLDNCRMCRRVRLLAYLIFIFKISIFLLINCLSAGACYFHCFLRDVLPSRFCRFVSRKICVLPLSRFSAVRFLAL